MSWWGKMAGGTFGFMLGGPLGAMLGTVVGHNLDQGFIQLATEQNNGGWGNQERIQSAFFTATFSVMGHLSKADGHISAQEIKLASDFMVEMTLNEEQRHVAQELFIQGKSPEFDLHIVLLQLRQECGRRQNLIRMFVEIQVQLAYADGVLHPEEQRILNKICDDLGIPPNELHRMHGAFKPNPVTQTSEPLDNLNQAYILLGASPTDDMATIKRKYRRLISQHHPDKLVAKGLPEEMMEMAHQKTQEIRKAYETIRKVHQH
jgi:DnaJ like chaperone protein